MKPLIGRSLLILSIVFALAAPSWGQTPEPDFAVLMERVRERVKQTYIDLQKLAWTDNVREEILKEDRTQKEKPRNSVYEMIIRLQPPTPEDTSGVPFYIREQRDLKLVDGKPPRKKDEPVSPTSGGIGTLLFLLLTGDRAADYIFSYGGQEDFQGRKALLVNITFPQKGEPRVIWDDRFLGIGYEFRITGVQYNKGKLWIDAATYDVLGLNWWSNPFEFARPDGKHKRRYSMELTARFKSMTFENPTQTFVVPESVEWINTLKGGRNPVTRKLHSFNNYKRFTGDIQIEPLAK
jgi:hypothetical protein